MKKEEKGVKLRHALATGGSVSGWKKANKK